MNILFITYNRLGDAVLSSGLLEHLRHRHPHARFTVACGPVPAQLFEPLPELARLIVLNKAPRLGHWRKLWRAMVGTHWDIVVDLRGSAIAWCLRAGKRYIDTDRNKDRHRVPVLGQVLGLDEPPAPTLWPTAGHREEAMRLLPDGPPVLVLAPTANWPGKCWPAERFASLAERLTGAGGALDGGRVAVCAAAWEREDAEPVLQAVPAERRVDLVGGGDLNTLFCCLQRAQLFVGNDSGLMHMAAAAGVPTLGLFGPSRDELYGPWGELCAAVRTPQSFDELIGAPDYDRHNTGSLMTGLEVETAATAAERLLQRAAARSAPNG